MYIFIRLILVKESLKIIKKSEAVSRGTTDNTMVKRVKTRDETVSTKHLVTKGNR